MKNILRKIAGKIRGQQYGFFGDYKTWALASNDSKGYDAENILKKVEQATLKVKNGESAYERDSVNFDKKEYSWPVLASLLFIASKNDRLNVLDFGGSLGSSYYQNLEFLEHIKDWSWHVVEQKNFVEAGKRSFEDQHLKFFDTIESSLKAKRSDVLLASSVVQYLEKPYEFLEKVVNSGIEYLLFDRTMFLRDKDQLTVQKVRPGIYDASYPAWFLNEKKFLEIVGRKYRLITDFDSLHGKVNLGENTGYEKGLFFVLK